MIKNNFFILLCFLITFSKHSGLLTLIGYRHLIVIMQDRLKLLYIYDIIFLNICIVYIFYTFFTNSKMHVLNIYIYIYTILYFTICSN